MDRNLTSAVRSCAVSRFIFFVDNRQSEFDELRCFEILRRKTAITKRRSHFLVFTLFEFAEQAESTISVVVVVKLFLDHNKSESEVRFVFDSHYEWGSYFLDPRKSELINYIL